LRVAAKPEVAFKYVFAAYKWIVVAPFLAFSTLIIGLIIMPLCLIGLPNFASRVFATAWARLNSAVSILSVELQGAEHIDPKQSYIIVANHQSLIDIYAVYGFLGVDFKWVMKKELRAVPILGIACELMGHILIDRSNTEAALKSINDAQARVKDGVSVVFFPEGTRSRNGELRQFKKGAFRFAQEMSLPILPIAIHGTKEILPSDTIDLAPGKAVIQVLEPIPTDNLSDEAISQLTLDVREKIATALENPLA
jgi:1-acyl-sn-glycerol-3-phosphate acyltransferase